MSPHLHDPFDIISALGLRVVFVPDFDDQVVLVRDAKILMVDPMLDRQSAADVALSLLGPSRLWRSFREAS